MGLIGGPSSAHLNDLNIAFNRATIFGIRGTFTGWVDANSKQFIFNGVGTYPSGESGTCVYVSNFGKYYVGDWKYIWIEAVADAYRNASGDVWFRLSSTGWSHCISPFADEAGDWDNTNGFIYGRNGRICVVSVRSSFKNQWIYGMSTTGQTLSWGLWQNSKLWFSNTPEE